MSKEQGRNRNRNNQGEFSGESPSGTREAQTQAVDFENDSDIIAMNEQYGEYRAKFVGQGISKGEDILFDTRKYPMKRIEDYLAWCAENEPDRRPGELIQHAKQVLMQQGDKIAGHWKDVPEQERA